MSRDSLGPIDNSYSASQGSPRQDSNSSEYVQLLLQKKKLELLEQINSFRKNDLSKKENNEVKSSTKDFLELKLEQINKIISFLENKAFEKK